MLLARSVEGLDLSYAASLWYLDVAQARRLPDVVETRMMELFECRLNLDDHPMSQAELVQAVKDADVLVRTAEAPPRFVPARAPEQILVRDLLAFIRRYGEEDTTALKPVSTPAIDALEQRLEGALDSALSTMSLRDLSAMASQANGRTTH